MGKLFCQLCVLTNRNEPMFFWGKLISENGGTEHLSLGQLFGQLSLYTIWATFATFVRNFGI